MSSQKKETVTWDDVFPKKEQQDRLKNNYLDKLALEVRNRCDAIATVEEVDLDTQYIKEIVDFLSDVINLIMTKLGLDIEGVQLLDSLEVFGEFDLTAQTINLNKNDCINLVLDLIYSIGFLETNPDDLEKTEFIKNEMGRNLLEFINTLGHELFHVYQQPRNSIKRDEPPNQYAQRQAIWEELRNANTALILAKLYPEDTAHIQEMREKYKQSRGEKAANAFGLRSVREVVQQTNKKPKEEHTTLDGILLFPAERYLEKAIALLRT